MTKNEGETLMHIARASQATTAFEYGCDLRRLYPWRGVADPLWGGAIASIRPRESTTPHSHNEEETFVILSGAGEIEIDGRLEAVGRYDVIYLPRFSTHRLHNLSDDASLDFLTIYWGSPEADARMRSTVFPGLCALAGPTPTV